eukprot:1294094-Pleurochrysis_carterae.AAC.1
MSPHTKIPRHCDQKSDGVRSSLPKITHTARATLCYLSFSESTSVISVLAHTAELKPETTACASKETRKPSCKTPAAH